MLLGWGCGVWLAKLIHQVITGGGSCGISGCPSVEEEEDGERFPKEDQCSAASPTHPYPPGCSHSAFPLTAHLLTAITPPSSSPPSPRLPLYLPPLLHLPSLSNSPSLTLSGTHTHTHHPPSTFSVRPSLSSFFTFLLGGSP